MEAFPYLGRTIAYINSNWAAVYQNMQKSQRRWGMLVMVLEMMRATLQAQGAMYKAVTQSVLLYGSEI